jgi:hypothetical protein
VYVGVVLHLKSWVVVGVDQLELGELCPIRVVVDDELLFVPVDFHEPPPIRPPVSAAALAHNATTTSHTFAIPAMVAVHAAAVLRRTIFVISSGAPNRTGGPQ